MNCIQVLFAVLYLYFSLSFSLYKRIWLSKVFVLFTLPQKVSNQLWGSIYVIQKINQEMHCDTWHIVQMERLGLGRKE